MGFFRVLAHACALTAADRFMDILNVLAIPKVSQNVKLPVPNVSSPWLTSGYWSNRTVDGAVLFGRAPQSGAKYALPKGLPKTGERTLAIENEPHTVDGFSGVIEEGYGKGVKTLLADETVVLKIKGKSVLTRMNYHVHDADKAGLHYDLVVEGLPEGTKQFEIHIPRGDYKGRYSFVTTDKGMIVVPMKDRSIVLPKPSYKLKDESFLAEVVAANPQDYVVERKMDGSLGNAVIEGERAYFRSHRETANAYTDKLPALEFLRNQSPFGILRTIDRAPKLSGTVLQGELVHQDGVSRVSGILNSHPEKAHAMQSKRGPVWFEGWDIVKLKGKDVSHLPAARRRELLEEVISEIQRYNPNWKAVERYHGSNPVAFYNKVINDNRGLPYSEGVVVKRVDDPSGTSWYKVKATDFTDVVLGPTSFLEGTGKYTGTLGALTVYDPRNGKTGEVGTGFSDSERDWIYSHQDELVGAVIRIKIMAETDNSFRAPVFHGFHPDPRFGSVGAEYGLKMYAEALAGGDPDESQRMLYRLKSSAGWKR